MKKSIAVLCFLLFSFEAGATVITTGCGSATACTAVEMNAGATMTVDQLTFERDGSFFIGSGFAESVFPDESQVIINGIDTTAGEPTLLWEENGQHYVNPADNQNFSNIDYVFTIEIAPGFEIYGTNLVLTPNIFTTNQLSLDAKLDVGGNINSVSVVGNSGGTPDALPDSNMETFATALTGTVAARLSLDANLINPDGDEFGAFDTISTAFKVRATEAVDAIDVAEPPILGLLAAGLLGLGFARRSRQA